MKTNKWMTRLLSSALVALGFTACDDENDPEDYPVEYGTPTVDYRVKGTVTDDTGNPIENIRVIIRYKWDNTPNPYMDDTVYTDKQGAFANEMNTTGGIGKQKVYFDDIDRRSQRRHFPIGQHGSCRYGKHASERRVGQLVSRTIRVYRRKEAEERYGINGKRIRLRSPTRPIILPVWSCQDCYPLRSVLQSQPIRTAVLATRTEGRSYMHRVMQQYPFTISTY